MRAQQSEKTAASAHAAGHMYLTKKDAAPSAINCLPVRAKSRHSPAAISGAATVHATKSHAATISPSAARKGEIINPTAQTAGNAPPCSRTSGKMSEHADCTATTSRAAKAIKLNALPDAPSPYTAAKMRGNSSPEAESPSPLPPITPYGITAAYAMRQTVKFAPTIFAAHLAGLTSADISAANAGITPAASESESIAWQSASVHTAPESSERGEKATFILPNPTTAMGKIAM